METAHLPKSPENAAYFPCSIEKFRKDEMRRQSLVDAD